MSLNKTLDRLFDEIRREAKRNPDFADRLDAVLRLHESRRDVADEVIEDIASAPAGDAKATERVVPTPKKAVAPASGRPTTAPSAKPGAAPALNPAGLFKREGEEALAAALADLEVAQLRALIAEHNLDPAALTGGFDRPTLADFILNSAKSRAKRDDAMFDY